MFNIRILQEQDYSELETWWRFWWKNGYPTQSMLPQNGTCGLMVSKNNINICAGFLYLTNSEMCMIEFIVSNHTYRDNDRAEALEFLIFHLGNMAKEQGCKIAYTSVKHNALIKNYKNSGWIEGSKNTIEMVKIL